jgi:hypothetical protein
MVCDSSHREPHPAQSELVRSSCEPSRAHNRAAAVANAVVEEGDGRRIDGLAVPEGWSREAATDPDPACGRACATTGAMGATRRPPGRPNEAAERKSPRCASLAEDSRVWGTLEPMQFSAWQARRFRHRAGLRDPLPSSFGPVAARDPQSTERGRGRWRASIASGREFYALGCALARPRKTTASSVLQDAWSARPWIAAPTAAVLYQLLRGSASPGRPTRVAHYEQRLSSRVAETKTTTITVSLHYQRGRCRSPARIESGFAKSYRCCPGMAAPAARRWGGRSPDLHVAAQGSDRRGVVDGP